MLSTLISLTILYTNNARFLTKPVWSSILQDAQWHRAAECERRVDRFAARCVKCQDLNKPPLFSSTFRSAISVLGCTFFFLFSTQRINMGKDTMRTSCLCGRRACYVTIAADETNWWHNDGGLHHLWVLSRVRMMGCSKICTISVNITKVNVSVCLKCVFPVFSRLHFLLCFV